jgi:hypothetical protein
LAEGFGTGFEVDLDGISPCPLPGIDCTDGFVIIKSGGIEVGEVSHHSSKQPRFKHFKTGKLVPTKALSAMT